MAAYDYICAKCSYKREVRHSMDFSGVVLCNCGEPMRKSITSMPRVSWNGLPPSDGDLAPAIQHHLNEAPYRLDKLGEKYDSDGLRISR